MTQNNVQLQNGNGPLAGLRNQVINGAFSTWQRGTGGVTNGGVGGILTYSADRWGIYSGANVGGQSSTVPTSGEFPFSISLTTAIASLQHRIEIGNENPFLSGTTWTLSCYSTAAIQILANGALVNLVPQGSADANGFQKYTYTWALSATETGDYFQLAFFPQATLLLTGVQLEPGPVATPFEHRSIAAELAMCQRYFTKVEGGVFMNAASRTVPNNSAILPYQLPTTMRATPTIVGTPTVSNGTYSTTNNLTKYGATFFATSTSSTNTARVTSDISFDAEL